MNIGLAAIGERVERAAFRVADFAPVGRVEREADAGRVNAEFFALGDNLVLAEPLHHADLPHGYVLPHKVKQRFRRYVNAAARLGECGRGNRCEFRDS